MVSSTELADLESIGSVLAGNITDQRPFLRQVSDWLMIVSFCVELDRRLAYEESPERIQFHRTMTGAAIGFGEFLLYKARKQETDLRPIGTDLETLEASLQLVWDIFAAWHSGMPKAHRDKIIEEVFGVAEPTA